MAKNWLFVARSLWPILTRAAKDEKILTYSEVAPLIGTSPLSMRYALGPIQDHCLETRRPPLTSIVVNKETRKPGGGFIGWDVDDLESGQRQTFDFSWENVPNPFGNLHAEDTIESLARRLNERPQDSGKLYKLVPDRGLGQVVFRAALLQAYDCQCAICGMTFIDALEAAHIVPWSQAAPSDRINVRNGLLLCANHHRLFDKGIMQITEDFEILSYDPDETDGPYTEADTNMTTAFHSTKLKCPENKELWPSQTSLKARRCPRED